MVEAGQHDLIAFFPITGNGAADVQGDGGHVVAENDLIRRRGVIKIRHGAVGFVQHFIGGDAGGKDAAVIGVVLNEIFCDAVDGLFGNLRTARVVEKDRVAIQGRKLLTNDIKIQ